MNTEALRKIGLSESEIKVYTALLKLGKANVTQLAEESGVLSPWDRLASRDIWYLHLIHYLPVAGWQGISAILLQETCQESVQLPSLQLQTSDQELELRPVILWTKHAGAGICYLHRHECEVYALSQKLLQEVKLQFITFG